MPAAASSVDRNEMHIDKKLLLSVPGGNWCSRGHDNPGGIAGVAAGDMAQRDSSDGLRGIQRRGIDLQRI